MESDSTERDDCETPRRGLDPDLESMRQIGYRVIDRVVEHLASLGERRVGRRGGGGEFAALVDEPLPEGPSSLEDCLEFFFERVAPRLTAVNHPRFHAYIPCPSSFAGAVGEMLAAGLNPFVGSWLGGATVASLELTVLRWIAELLGYDPRASGILTSGGSMANLVGLAAARARGGPDALPRGVIYVSQEGHASVNKAARLLGFPEEAIRALEVDDAFRLDPRRLGSAIQADRAAGRLPLFAAANAGTTNTGAVDPLNEVANICHHEGVWLHVDGAYGGFAALDPRGRQLLRGMERADSLTLDPHKWLYCPIGVGCALVRDGQWLTEAFRSGGDYLQDLPADEVNFLERGPELSRPARALSVWMVVRSVGRQALAEQIGEDLRLARLAAELLRQDPRLEVRAPSLSIVTFGHRRRDGEPESQRSARDLALMEATMEGGELMLSSTRLKGRTALRFVVMNHRTTAADIRRSVRAIRDKVC